MKLLPLFLGGSVALAAAALHSPKGAEHQASLGTPMSTASALPVQDLAVRPPRQTNWVLTVAWNEPDTNVTGYILHWGPAGNLTNRFDVGPTNSDTFTFPQGGYTWVGVTAYDSQDEESDMSALIHWPLFQAWQFSGSSLQCRPSLSSGTWSPTNSPYWATNPTGSLFFRSSDPGGPSYSTVWTQ